MKICVWLLILILFFLPAPKAASAHPADEYLHDHVISIHADRVEIIWEITPGPLLAELIWYEADLSRNGIVSEKEAAEWASYTIEYFHLEIDQTPIDLYFDAVTWPGELMSLYTSNEPIQIKLSARWHFDSLQPQQISFHNTYIPINSVNWYAVESEIPVGFDLPEQSRGKLTLQVGQHNESGGHPLTHWESGRPTIRWHESDLGLRSAMDNERSLSTRSTSAGSLLMNFVLENDSSTQYILMALLIAILLGIMHAFSPGHGKTVVAAYLVGSQGVPLHAVALGLLVSITHTGTVFLLGLLAFIAAQNIVLLEVFPILEFLSGALILILGLVMAITRLKDLKGFFKNNQPKNNSSDIQVRQNGKYSIRLNQPIREEGPSHSHDPKKFGFIPKRAINGSEANPIQWRSLIMLGISSGLVPCPNAITILLIAIAVNRIVFGLSMIMAFSLGLAVTLIVIGLLIMQGKRLFTRLQWFDRIARYMPLMSGVALVGIGAALTLAAAPNLYNRTAYISRPAVIEQASPFEIDKSKILFLDKDKEGLTQLFGLRVMEGQPNQLTQNGFGIRNYAVSPVSADVLYTTIDGLDSRIWQLNLVTDETILLLDCVEAICANPTWMTDANGFLYQRQDFTRQEDDLFYNTAYPSIWWFDIDSKQTKPLFQDAQLPGINPQFSPDGQYLSYFTISSRTIHIYQLETGEHHSFPSLTGLPPAWSPDGDWLIVGDIKEEQGIYQNLLKTYDLMTETLTWLDANPSANDHSPTWSPDGDWIAFYRIIRDADTQAAQSQVWLKRPNGADARPVIDHKATYHGNLHWSPDSQYLLYDVQVRVENGFAHQIHLLDIVSGKVEVLTASGTRPEWLPCW